MPVLGRGIVIRAITDFHECLTCRLIVVRRHLKFVGAEYRLPAKRSSSEHSRFASSAQSFQLRRANHPTGLLFEQMAKDVEIIRTSIAHVNEASPFRRATDTIDHTSPDIRLALELLFALAEVTRFTFFNGRR